METRMRGFGAEVDRVICPSTVTGHSSAVGCVRIGAFPKSNSRCTWVSSSSCITSASEAKRCCLRSLSCWSRKPTVSLGVTSAVVSSCGHDNGQIEHRVAHQLARHWATHGGPAERHPHRPPPHAQPLAPVRHPHGRRPRRPPRGCTDHTPPSDAGHPCGRLREAQRQPRSLVPRDARPRRRSSFCLLTMASPYWKIYVSY